MQVPFVFHAFASLPRRPRLKPMLFEGKERKQREQEMQRAGRLPPGQALTLKWPVLHYGSVPSFDPATWDFRVFGLVEKPVRLRWPKRLC